MRVKVKRTLKLFLAVIMLTSTMAVAQTTEEVVDMIVKEANENSHQK